MSTSPIVPRSPWPQRPETDQRGVGYLWVPADAVFLPAVEEVARAALLTAGGPRVPLPPLIAALRDLVAAALLQAEPERSWLLELETDDDDIYARIWMRLREPRDVTIGPELRAALEAVTGSFDLQRDGTGFLAVLQIELSG